MDILKSVIHRMGLLEQTHANLKGNLDNIDDDTDILDRKISTELMLLKKETSQILADCDEIRKNVFTLGSHLRSKVSKREINEFEQIIQDWPVQDYITQKELKPTFSRYSKH